MAYKTIRTNTRPNIYVPFFLFNEEIRKYIDEKYNQTGKRISFNTTISEDELQQINTSVWVDQATFKEFLEDPVICGNGDLVKEYNKAFDISLTIANEEV
jgi:hypothetical protein